jgi:hypothetical protein
MTYVILAKPLVHLALIDTIFECLRSTTLSHNVLDSASITFFGATNCYLMVVLAGELSSLLGSIGGHSIFRAVATSDKPPTLAMILTLSAMISLSTTQ